MTTQNSCNESNFPPLQPTQGGTGLAAAPSFYNGGRLTLTTGVPVTTGDVLAAVTVYYTPFKGNVIALFTAGAWKLYSFAELGIAIPAAASQMYDVFVLDVGGVAALVLTAWATDTTRATALALQDGVYCQAGALNRRYVGSFRTTAVAGQSEDSVVKRYLWSYNNRVEKGMVVVEATDQWNYTVAAYRQANANAANQLDFVQGVSEDIVSAEVYALAANAGATVIVYSGIGLNVTNANSAIVFGTIVTQNTGEDSNASYRGYPGVGRTFLTWLENSAAAGTTTWYGTITGGVAQHGIFGSAFF